MATAIEIQKVLEIACKEANQYFQNEGLDIRTSHFKIEVLAESKMWHQNCNGVFVSKLNKIELRRALFTDVIDTMKQNPRISIYKLYDYKRIVNTLLHEIGHGVHFNRLNKRDFDLHAIDSYGRKNHEEKFAVAFQEYFTEERKHNGIAKCLELIK